MRVNVDIRPELSVLTPQTASVSYWSAPLHSDGEIARQRSAVIDFSPQEAVGRSLSVSMAFLNSTLDYTTFSSSAAAASIGEFHEIEVAVALIQGTNPVNLLFGPTLDGSPYV